MKDIVLNAFYQPDNILVIPPYKGEKDDRVLLDLIPFLKGQHSLNDMREVHVRYVDYTDTLKANKEKEQRLMQESEKKERIGIETYKGSSEDTENSILSNGITKGTGTSGERTGEVSSE